MRIKMPLRATDRSSNHCAREQRGREHAAGSACNKRRCRSDDLQHRQRRQHLPGELVMHGLVHIFVARAHDLRRTEISHESDEQAGARRLKILGPARKRAQPGAKESNGTGKHHRCQTAHYSQQTIRHEFRRTIERERWNSKQRLRTQKPAHHYHAGDGRQHD